MANEQPQRSQEGIESVDARAVFDYSTYQDLQRSLSCNILIRRGHMTQPDIWIGIIEISWMSEKIPNVFQPAFTVVTTWAASPEEFREKCIRMLESYGWKLLDVERANPVPDDGAFSEEVEDMLERTRSNPSAIIYGTFHSYPVV
jgi:hypothetical protein